LKTALYKRGERGQKMQTLAWLTQEIPWVMAPAILIAATAAISLLSAVIRSTDIASKAMVIGVMIALTVGIMLMEVAP
jgi:hypothetical protein